MTNNDQSINPPVKSNQVTQLLNRRHVLRGLGLGTSVAALGLGSVGTVAGDSVSVSGGGAALQTAIDNANDGDTVVVTDSATYDSVTIEDGITLEATDDPTIEGDGGTGAAISIAADDVTVKGFTVTNPGGLLGIKVEKGYDDTTIKRNTVENIGPTGRFGVTGITVGQGDHDGIEITNNEIRNLDQETTEDSKFPTVNGIGRGESPDVA
ncbi:hypothetical protein [Natronomonas sp.]|uniref:hypothetical protein n=1 Tax=Natronomonas sp. TaxID=2184060 RepID=UPI003975FE23